jgi:hypothetical protein
VVLIARITGAIAALTWLIGAPLFSLAGVPFPSDAQYIVLGVMAGLLGLTLAPITLVIGGEVQTRFRAIVRYSGLGICLALLPSGALLALAANGRLGERAPDWIPEPAIFGLTALFLWVSVVSWAKRGASTIERGTFWLGLLTGASCLVPFLAAVVMFYFVRDFVFTNATILPFLLVFLVLWISLPVWLTAVVIGLKENPGARTARSAGQ